MEDVIAVEVRLADGARRFFVTWGRIQDVVDPDPVCAVVMRFAQSCALGGQPVAARVCSTLREAAETEDAPMFYEARREQIAKEMERGRSIYYCGQPQHR
jgi:hypothetical protein